MKLYTLDITNVPSAIGCYCRDPDHFIDIDFASDPAIDSLQEDLSSDFVSMFSQGMNAYLAGEWAAAKVHFEAAQKIVPTDGPTRTLLDYLQKCAYVKPVDWDGCREFVEK
jgi:hypothetical protein